MKKLLLFAGCLLLLAFRAHAQDIYELTFTSGDVKYKGLLVLFNESNMYMRVAYNAEGMYKVVHVDYTSEHGEANGVEYLALIGSNPRFITESGKYGYNPDQLFFTDILDVPVIIFDLEDPDNSIIADTFTPLETGKVSDSYLRQFYGSNESDYFALRKIFGLESAPVVNKTYESPVTLHLVVIANTAIGDIGTGCSVDQRNLESEFRGISEALGISFKPYLINGENFTKTHVLNTLSNQLTVGSNDIVVCVYRGHGFRWADQTDVWPQLDIRTSSYVRLTENTTISLSEVYNKITTKGARLNIILGDCCNNNIGLSQVTSNNFLSMQNNNQYNLSKLRDLFINYQGNLLSCAASPGEYSWVSNANGGFFTVSFLQALREEISYLRNDQADWQDIIHHTIQGARSKTAACSNCTPQNGKLYFGITPKK